MTSLDQQNKEKLVDIDEKLVVGLKNAAQGEYGIHFATKKIDDIKADLDFLDANMKIQAQKTSSIKSILANQPKEQLKI